MPLAILVFDLPEDDAEHQLALQGQRMFAVLHELDNRLRSKIKHGDLTDEQSAPYQEVRNWLFEACEDEGVDLS